MSQQRTAFIRRGRLILLVILSAVLAVIILTVQESGHWPLAQAQERASDTPSTAESENTPTPSLPVQTIEFPAASQEVIPLETELSGHSNPSPSLPPAIKMAPGVSQPERSATGAGTLYLSMYEGGFHHLFAYHPQSLPITRLTHGAWDDVTPAASPDGKRLALASNRDGQWDLYILSLENGEFTRITDSPQYEASPSWSPDGQWIVYESYVVETVTIEKNNPDDVGLEAAPTITETKTLQNFELFIRQVSSETPIEGEPIRLTFHSGSDHSPDWSPAGRKIAFVSNRSGQDEIWIADLDKIEDRFSNVSQAPNSMERRPSWSPDGSSLAWSSREDGYQNLYVWDSQTPNEDPIYLGSGEQPVWGPSGEIILTALQTPNNHYLSGYSPRSAGLALPPLKAPGPVNGMSWAKASLLTELPASIEKAARVSPTPAWRAILTPVAEIPDSRQRVVPLDEVDAPTPMLHDKVDESFQALRETLIDKIGWDYLATLENAFVPLTSPLYPGMLNDWLYTGRAFTLNPAPMKAGWMVVVREDFGSATYWRVYLRTRFQDGTQGAPLYQQPWDFEARSSGDPLAYEQGGALHQEIPPGYWLDFTRLATSYGWHRLPALVTWRSAYQAARFNEFVFSDGLDWQSAMQEIYPREALATPTPVLPPTNTPTPTRWPTRTPLPTRTPWPSQTPTPSHTSTPDQPPSSTPSAVILTITTMP